jgi:hypothetical protein
LGRAAEGFIVWIDMKFKAFLIKKFTLKERGHYYICYMYVTVFIRNAANLTHLIIIIIIISIYFTYRE